MLLVVLFSLATLLLWGMSDYLAGRSGRDGNPYVVNFIIQAVGLLALTPWVLTHGLHLGDPFDLLIIVVCSGLLTLAYLYFIRALARGPVGVAAPIANSYAVVTLVVSLLFFGVVLSGLAIVALVLVILGALLLSTDRTLFRGKIAYIKTIRLAAVPFLAWGVGFALLNRVEAAYSWHELLFLILVVMVVLTAIVMVAAAPKQTWHPRGLFSAKNAIAVWCGGLAVLGASAFFVAADIEGHFVIPAVIASASPLVTSLIASIVDKEKLTIANRIGAVIVVAGVALLSLP